MSEQFPRPPEKYDQSDQAHTRRIMSQALAATAKARQLGQDSAVLFAALPPTAPAGARYFVTDRGPNGKPLWSDGAGGWVDGAGTVVT